MAINIRYKTKIAVAGIAQTGVSIAYHLKKILFSLIVLLSCFQLSAQDFTAANDLVQRRVPWLINKVKFEKISKTKEGNDVFTLDSKGKK